MIIREIAKKRVNPLFVLTRTSTRIIKEALKL